LPIDDCRLLGGHSAADANRPSDDEAPPVKRAGITDRQSESRTANRKSEIINQSKITNH
jgi:hypothetical protein